MHFKLFWTNIDFVSKPWSPLKFLSLLSKNVRKSASVGEKRQTGGFDLQERREVPEQRRDEESERDRKRQCCYWEASL